MGNRVSTCGRFVIKILSFYYYFVKFGRNLPVRGELVEPPQTLRQAQGERKEDNLTK
jgi:hypothetical protein